MKIVITESQLNLICESKQKYLNDEQILRSGYPLFYHGTTDKNLSGKTGIHVGTKASATQALQAKIGVPAKGEWDGTREYGKTLLAGKKTLKKMNLIVGYDPIINFNATDDVPEEDYYPTERKKRATYYSTKTLIPLNSKPIVFQVIIIGEMENTYDTPYTDEKANKLMDKKLKNEKANKGYYYINKWEDENSISAVVPNGSFLEIIEKQNEFKKRKFN